MHVPYLKTDYDPINRAFRMALGDLVGNIVPFKDGLLDRESLVVMAGMDYVTPWTRDASINTWNGAGLLFPDVTRNTLLSVLGESDGELRIAGEYWDAIIWAVGAWWQYLYTGDLDFLRIAYDAVKNSLSFFEETEFSPELNLFRGGACYGDGISAYPDRYVTDKKLPGIIDWPPENPDLAAKPGVGVPTHVLSTNCLYYYAYVIAGRMAAALGETGHPSWAEKAMKIKDAINTQLWNEDKGRYDYLADPFGGCDYQEGMGQSFAVLFGVADESLAAKIFQNVYVTPAGIPCVWPSFHRYDTPDGHGYGRHSGTVWPHIQGFWAHAAAMCGEIDIFAHEMNKLAEHVSRDAQFAEIYHPETGEIYGGRQEWKQDGIVEWKSCTRQTWSATAFIRMILMGLIGMEFYPGGILFKPLIPEGYGRVSLKGLPYRGMEIDIHVTGTGSAIRSFKINGVSSDVHELRADLKGNIQIAIEVSP